ncbi:hypothetical protein DXG01_002142 [Tephrocybe rancida]|nr:hypothetical protein DXG01_002142 [Tephrocybe rancida]
MAETPADNITLNGGTATPAHNIDVIDAEEQFNALSRQLSIRSQEVHRKRSSLSEKTVGSPTDDLEKAEPKGDASDRFDLREYLSSSNDANQSAGIQHKHVGLTWEDLQVDVMGGLDHKFYVGTLSGATLAFFLGPFFWLWSFIAPLFPSKAKMPTRTILHKSSGVLKPGEMCLVLGCPGSGCSTFLKTIANQREEFASVTGNVLYAGISAEEMAKYYKGEVVYNQEGE